MTVAFLFPGQGSEQPRMGLALAAASPAAHALLERASEAAAVDVRSVLSRGGPAFARTEVIQPALTAVCLGALHELSGAGVRPAVVAGHSLGELMAWCAAGCITPRDAVAVAGRRGQLMAAQAARHPGGMSALVGRGADAVERALAWGRDCGTLDLAAHNAPLEWVVSGDEAALQRVERVTTVVRLRVAGPWHCRLMAGAVDPLLDLLLSLPRAPAKAAFLANRTGAVVADESRIPALLAEQLCHPVRWATTLQTLAKRGVTDLVTVGPGRTLRGLIRKNLGDALRVHGTDTPRDLSHTLEALA